VTRRDTEPADRTDAPSVAEIAALTARLRHLTSTDTTAGERAEFQADKHALLARIAAAEEHDAAARAEQLTRWHTDDREGADEDTAGWSQ
jgi:hypothetical protein